jgi:hypothetical protein
MGDATGQIGPRQIAARIVEDCPVDREDRVEIEGMTGERRTRLRAGRRPSSGPRPPRV